MSTMTIAIPNQTWLNMGGGTSSDLLERLHLHRPQDIEIGPSTFTIHNSEAFVMLELRHPHLPERTVALIDADAQLRYLTVMSLEMSCCSEYGCKRKKPIMLMRSDLTETWYVVTDYTDKGNGHFVAKTKHRLSDDQQRQLEELRNGASFSDEEKEVEK